MTYQFSPDEIVDWQKITKMFDKLMPILKKMGPPREVLPTCLFICFVYGKESGASLEEFMQAVQNFANIVWEAHEI